MPALAVPVLAMMLCAAACAGGGDGDDADSDAVPQTTPPTAGASSPTRSDGASDETPSPTGDPTQDVSFPGAVSLSEWLPFGGLQVRAVAYRRDGVSTGGADRIDVVTVEECASAGTVAVPHHTWHLVDGSGRTLGAAGAKLVNGVPTEDIPRELAAGQCAQTQLAVAVDDAAAVAAIKDGRVATWLLTD